MTQLHSDIKGSFLSHMFRLALASEVTGKEVAM